MNDVEHPNILFDHTPSVMLRYFFIYNTYWFVHALYGQNINKEYRQTLPGQ